MNHLVLIFHGISMPKETFSADWNDKQNLGNLITSLLRHYYVKQYNYEYKDHNRHCT